MPTLSQVLKGCRVQVRKAGGLGRPQLSARVVSWIIRKPKKPNSADRKCVKVRLSTGKGVEAAIPGETQGVQLLQPHSRVLVRGGRRQDTVGMHLLVVRRARGYDCPGVPGRKSARSRYGAPRPRGKES